MMDGSLFILPKLHPACTLPTNLQTAIPTTCQTDNKYKALKGVEIMSGSLKFQNSVPTSHFNVITSPFTRTCTT